MWVEKIFKEPTTHNTQLPFTFSPIRPITILETYGYYRTQFRRYWFTGTLHVDRRDRQQSGQRRNQCVQASRVNFEDLMYQMVKQPGTPNANGDMSPAGIYVGLGTKISNTQLDMTQGSLESTGGPWMSAIQGNGFFRVKILRHDRRRHRVHAQRKLLHQQ